jgi:hypothetical protein
VTLKQPRLLGRPVKPGDDNGECCAFMRFATSDSRFQTAKRLRPRAPRELGF